MWVLFFVYNRVMKQYTAYYQFLQQFQAQRLQREYQYLAEQPQYRKLADFFFNDMYGPQDFKARDTQARRLHHFIHLAPGLTMRDIEVSLELLELTTDLDEQITQMLVSMQAPLPFDEATYEEAYFKADAYQPRVRQIELLRESLTRVSRFAAIPVLGTALSNMKTLARLTGMRELHAFLVKGYYALSEVEDLEPFLSAVETKEMARLDRIYGVSE